MNMTTTERATIQAEIDTLRRVEHAIETNEGTYGAAECCRATGNGDPRSGDYTIYETVSGTRRVQGCKPTTAPGRARRLTSGLAEDRKRVANLLKQLRGLSRRRGD